MSDIPVEGLPEDARGDDLVALLGDDPELAALISGALSETGQEGEEGFGFLGIPEGVLTGRQASDASRIGEVGLLPDQTITGDVRADPRALGTRPVRFTEVDVYAPLGLSGSDIVQRQDNLVDAGMLAEGSFVRGIWDKPSQDAQRQVLALSNLSGKDPDDLMLDLSSLKKQQQERLREEAIRKATARFVRQDPATVRTTMKRSVQNLLGREPTDQEMAELTAEFRGFEGQNLAQQQRLAAEQIDFQTNPDRAGETSLMQTATDVDPMARMEEFMAERFAGTITQNKRVEEMQAGQHNLLRMADRMARMIGNG